MKMRTLEAAGALAAGVLGLGLALTACVEVESTPKITANVTDWRDEDPPSDRRRPVRGR